MSFKEILLELSTYTQGSLHCVFFACKEQEIMCYTHDVPFEIESVKLLVDLSTAIKNEAFMLQSDFLVGGHTTPTFTSQYSGGDTMVNVNTWPEIKYEIQPLEKLKDADGGSWFKAKLVQLEEISTESQ